MKKILRGLGLAGAIMAIAGGTGCANLGPGEKPVHSIRLGALLSLSGDRAQSGAAQHAAMECAVEDIRKTLRFRGRPVSVEISYADTGARPEQAYEKLRRLRQEDIHAVIGPDSSEEAMRILPWANRFDMILVSPSSTAHSLSIPGDNLFRLAPDDDNQAAFMAEQIRSDGIQIVVPIWRDDSYAMDLLSGFRHAFLSRGGTVLRGVRYDPRQLDAEATVEALRALVEETADAYGAARLAIYLIAFDEAVSLLHAGAESAVLSSVSWYANEAVALNAPLVTDEQAGSLAATVRLTCPQLEQAKRAEAETLTRRLEARLGRTPERYALAAYDAVWLLTRVQLRAGRHPDAPCLRRLLTKMAARQRGLCGPLAFNEAGDLAYAAYALFRVQPTADGPAWVRVPEKP